MAKPDGPAIRAKALAAAASVDAWLADLQRVERMDAGRTLSREQLRQLAGAISGNAADSPDDWDTLAPQYLALAALFHADGAALEDCALLENSHVGTDCHIRYAMLGAGSRVADRARLWGEVDRTSVLADKETHGV